MIGSVRPRLSGCLALRCSDNELIPWPSTSYGFCLCDGTTTSCMLSVEVVMRTVAGIAQLVVDFFYVCMSAAARLVDRIMAAWES